MDNTKDCKRAIMNTIDEKKVYDSISQCLEDGEKIEVTNRYFDFYLPNGFKIKNWPNNTYIDVKYRLAYDTFSRLQKYYNISKAQKLIVIITIENFDKNSILEKYSSPGMNIDVLTLKDFINSLPISLESIATDSNDYYYIAEKTKSIEQKAKEALKQNRVCLFLGAGVSKSAGVVTWENLLEQLCVKKGLSKIDSDIDNVIKGRYIVDEYQQHKEEMPDDFNNDMRSILYANIQPSLLIDAIAELVKKCHVESIVSYNYDDLVEQKVNSIIPNKCQSVFDKSRPNNGDEIQVYHVHGFIPQNGTCSPIVLGEKEYHKVYQDAYNWGNVEQLHSLCRNVCFFIGLSMSDPNLRRLIDVSIDGSEIEPIHFAFLRRIEYDIPFMEKIMRGFGINCIWYDEHKDLPTLINKLI